MASLAATLPPPGRSHPIADAWEPTRQLTLEAARRRTRQLSVLRLVFVGLASASFSAFFGFMTLHAALGGFGGADELTEVESLKMVNPRFSGRTGANGLFDVTATTATRRGPQSDLIDLDMPVYTAADRKVTARTGVYNQVARTVELNGDVVFTDAGGNTFTSTQAFVDARENRVEGRRAIRGEGPLGSVRADSYEIRDSGDRIVFRGRVKGVVKQGQGSAP
ncbi:MAG: LPS export ABC transporter periplasmic protein LptC [Hyphomonadaceae bacterium]|nr:LPS export ABC transporter periplasmic protein LptC [Hyphomonadaceae bacterium]